MDITLRRVTELSLPLAPQPSHVTAATVLYYTPVVGQYIVILYYTVVDCVQTAAKSVAATCGRVL